MKRSTRVRPWWVVMALIAASCDQGFDGRSPGPLVPDHPDPVPGDEDDQQLDVEPLDLNDSFDRASDAFDVPVQLLKSIAYTETRWQMVDAEPEFEDRPGTFGLMALRSDRIEDAAELAGVDVDQAQTDPDANILAAAAWLSAEADRSGVEDRSDLGSWAEVAAAYSGIEDEIGRASYVYDGVFPTIREGLEVETVTGEWQGDLEPVDAWPSFTLPPPAPALEAGPDYSGSVWRPSGNYSSRPGGASGDPSMVIVHSCEGSYAGCWSWLRNGGSGVSAHYVIKENGNEITQLVRESKKAWHISATYSCDRNSGTDCWRNGSSSNNFTIGIEHAGFANQASWEPNLIDQSARLVCDISQDHSIPRDQYHVVAHGQLQPWNRIDPGPNWPWGDYFDLIDAHCGGGGAPPPADPEPEPEPPADDPPGGGGDPPPPGGDAPDTIVIDSNNDSNQLDQGFIAQSANWASSAGSAQKFNTGYWYASTKATSDPATFWFYSPDGGDYGVDAWWTQGGNRTTHAPFVIYADGAEGPAVVHVNMQADGGQWNTLGTWTFAPGWNKVQLSRWSSAPGVVIADAVRVRKQ